jgi:hypothetical protein
MDIRTNLLAEAERYCAGRRISKARLATIVVNDGKFFDRIEKGGDFTVRTYERFVDFFASHTSEASQ